MLSPLLTLTLVTVAGPATINDVRTNFEEGRLTVEVATSAPVDRSALSAKIAGGKLHLYVDQGRTRGDRTRFEGAEALARSSYAKIEIPWQQGTRCAGPIALAATESGLRASVACEATEGAVTGPAPVATDEPKIEAPAAVAAAEPTPKPAEPMDPAVADEMLKAALDLPAEPAPVVVKPEPTVTPTATRNAGAPAAESAGAPATESPGTPAAKSAGAPATKPAVIAPAPAVAPPALATAKPAAFGSVVMPALVLIGIAGAAFFVSRRKAKREGLITILETAHLGPKRSLVLARVGGETMILGSSEAGITMLRPLDSKPAAPLAAPAATATATMDDVTLDITVDDNAQASAPVAAKTQTPEMPKTEDGEPTDEIGWLSRLFHRRPDNNVRSAVSPEETRAFDQILHESLEDQDLRRRLAAGQGGKVS